MDIIVGAVVGFGILAAGVVIAPTIKMAMDLAPYLYTNTRCSARTGLLITKEVYDNLVAASDIREVLSILEYSNYSYVAEHGGDFFKISGLLEKDLHDSYDWLENVVPEKLSPIIRAMKIRFEINEIRDALNRVKDGKEIGELHYIEDPSLKLKLESATDYLSFAAAMEGSRYGDVFSGKNLSLLPIINTDLDRYYYSEVMRVINMCADKKAAEPFKDYWKRMIDIVNVRLALRKIGSGIESMSFVDGGTIDAKDFSGISDSTQLTEILQKSPYADCIGDDIDNGMQKFLKKDSGMIDARNSLKGGSIVRFIISKELEIRNLNIILKLKHEGFKRDEIGAFLVV